MGLSEKLKFKGMMSLMIGLYYVDADYYKL